MARERKGCEPYDSGNRDGDSQIGYLTVNRQKIDRTRLAIWTNRLLLNEPGLEHLIGVLLYIFTWSAFFWGRLRENFGWGYTMIVPFTFYVLADDYAECILFWGCPSQRMLRSMWSYIESLLAQYLISRLDISPDLWLLCDKDQLIRFWIQKVNGKVMTGTYSGGPEGPCPPPIVDWVDFFYGKSQLCWDCSLHHKCSVDLKYANALAPGPHWGSSWRFPKPLSRLGRGHPPQSPRLSVPFGASILRPQLRWPPSVEFWPRPLVTTISLWRGRQFEKFESWVYGYIQRYHWRHTSQQFAVEDCLVFLILLILLYVTWLVFFAGDDMDKYTILLRIGEGAHGVVYKAKHIESGEVVALKKVFSA